ncbi:hypothetical protein [Hoeflea sp.]
MKVHISQTAARKAIDAILRRWLTATSLQFLNCGAVQQLAVDQ